MMKSVLLDTSFCIRLVLSTDPLHQNALSYFKFFLENKVEMYLSSIAVAEYSVKGDITGLPLHQMKILPFSFDDGRIAGQFQSILLNRRNELAGMSRDSVKDDCKLIAQIYNRNIDAYITADHKSIKKIIEPITNEKGFLIEVLDLNMPLRDF